MMKFIKNHIFSFENKCTDNIENHHHNEKKVLEKDNKNLYLKKNDDTLKEIKNEECCICLEEIHSKKKIIMSNCRHQLHIKCAKEWFYNNANCPLCRSEQRRLKERICSQ